VNPRLATALVYGIKRLLRRIERPALPAGGLRALGRALSKTSVEEGIHLLVLGRVGEEMIPQVADLGLQAEGAVWSIAAGNVGSDLVFSVRNVGHVRAAGDVVRRVVEGVGVGGGHRSMAKGIIPLKAFREVYGSAKREKIREALHDAFVNAINREDD